MMKGKSPLIMLLHEHTFNDFTVAVAALGGWGFYFSALSDFGGDSAGAEPHGGGDAGS